ncbi:Ig-like domain-containing protein [Rathayibacter sp. ZW T2_19]|uniref:Ig-like domain-containing protein n=1 Tax=Rathayibacter rubneri TaxID=2950106 RepID=A0A9X2IS41_9MICO|nr:Ig-like domain-containing protein [Rathayibacter rubneri]MCM6761532.1 Ig-like domain-containing protein [Rathayibacter rubneri]
MRTPRRSRAATAALATALTAVLAGSVLVAAPASAATAWDPYSEGLQNSNESLGYPTFTNGASAIPPTTATYDPTVSHLGKIYAADLAAGAGSAPGKDFWLDRMLSRDGVQPDEPGGLDFTTDQPANVDYDNNGVFFSRGRAVYMQNSDAGLGFRGRIAYIEDLGQSGSTLTASVNGAAVSLTENQAKRHNTPSYWYSEYTGGGLLVKQTKFISRQNVAVERLQISTTDGSTKTVALRAESGLARTAAGSELTGSVTTANNVTQVSTRYSGDGFGVDGTALTRTVSASATAADVKLQLGFTTTEIPESTTEFQSIAAATPQAAFTTQTTSYNTWWVENIPYLETPSGEIDKTLFYRWWLLRTNFLDAQVPGNDYQFPTSMEGVFGAAYNNAIVLTAGMFIEDMKYFRDPSSAYGTWLSAGETARESRYIDNPGNPAHWNSSYTNYISEAAWNSYALHGGDAAIADKLATYAEDDVAGQLAEFDKNKNNLLEYSNPALTGNDVDAVSFSWRNRDAWNSYPMDRPESAYLYSGAVAAAEAYRLAGDTAGADRMTAKAEAIKKSVLDVLWEDKRSTADEAGFFGNMIKASYSDGSSGLAAGSKIPWKEVNMYYPYTVGLMPKPGDADFDQKYLDAFRLFVDSEQYAPFPFYTANQKDAKARALRDAGSGKHYSNNFSTINSTVMFRLLSSTLRDYPNSYLTSDYYKKMLYWNAWASYEKGDVTRQNENEFWSHGSAADGGSIKYRSWIHQTQLGTTNFTVVEDAMGLQARTDSVLELSPIDIDWDHFTANNLKYHDKDLTIVWDEPGGTRHYGDTPEGYSVYLDGKRAFTIDSLVPVEFDTVTGEVTTDATVLFSAANAVKPAQDVRFASTDRVVDLLGKAGVDVDPTTSSAPELAQGTTATASYSAGGNTPSGKSLVPANAVDGSTVNEPFWGTAGSPNASDWLEIDLGSAQKVNQAGIYFYRTSSGTTVQGYSAPKSYSVQYWDGAAWKSVTAQARTPKVPTGNENTVRFADVTAQKFRVLVAHQQGQKTGIKEVQLKNVAAAYTPAENAAPVVSIQRLAVADPSIARFVGTASDDGLPIGELTQAWTVVAKPADSTATFTDAASAATTVRFSKPGSYTLRFTASDTVKQTTLEQVVEVSDVRPLGPEVGSYATPSASYVAPWNRLASINDGETVPGVQTEQTKLWGTYADGARPASQTLTYTWSTPTRLAGAGASFWNDAEQGSGGGVALPASWSLEYLDGTTWKPVALRAGTQYPVNAMGTPSEVAFTPVTTTQLRATFQASRATSGAYSAIGASEFDVYADYPGSFEAVAKRTTVNTPVTLPATVIGVYSDGSRGELRATWDAIPASRFATPGTITATGVLTGSTQAITATISVGDSGSEIASIEQQTATTALGKAPDLPRTAVAVFSGGTGAKESRPVTWDAVAPASYATAGTFTVLGAMAGTTLRPSVTVTVEGGAATAPKAPAAPTVAVAGDAATVSWTAPADGGAAITGYTATVTPTGGAAITKTGTTTSAVFTALPAGTYTASVVATNPVGASAASPTASFTIAAAPALKVTATASTRCISGKVVLTVTAKNEEATPMGMTLRTAYGTKVFTGVKPGSSATQSFTTRLGSIPAGTATVDATATVNGTALTRTVDAPYTARTC